MLTTVLNLGLNITKNCAPKLKNVCAFIMMLRIDVQMKNYIYYTKFMTYSKFVTAYLKLALMYSVDN